MTGASRFRSILEDEFPEDCKERAGAEFLLEILAVEPVQTAMKLGVGFVGKNSIEMDKEAYEKLTEAERSALISVKFPHGKSLEVTFEPFSTRLKAFEDYCRAWGYNLDPKSTLAEGAKPDVPLPQR